MINYITELYYSIVLKDPINYNDLVQNLFENSIYTDYNINKTCNEIILFSVFDNQNELVNKFYSNNNLYGSNISKIINKTSEELKLHYNKLVDFEIINPFEVDYNSYLINVNKVIDEYNVLLSELTDDMYNKKGNMINMIEKNYNDNIKSKQWNERIIII